MSICEPILLVTEIVSECNSIFCESNIQILKFFSIIFVQNKTDVKSRNLNFLSEGKCVWLKVQLYLEPGHERKTFGKSASIETWHFIFPCVFFKSLTTGVVHYGNQFLLRII